MSRFTNDHMIHKQVRMHWNHIKDCDDHHDVDLTDLLSRIEAIETWIKNHPDETVLLSLEGPSGGTPRDSGSNVPNSVAFDSLLAGIDTMEEADLNAFYNAHISKVVGKYNDNLLAPIKVTDLPGCTVKGSANTTNNAVTWADLNKPEDIAKKRAYVEQFILANRSNQTRATYLTNHLVGSIALPIWQ